MNEAERAQQLLDKHAASWLRCVRAILQALPDGGPRELTQARDELAEYVDRRARGFAAEERPTLTPRSRLEENQEKRETAIGCAREARRLLRNIKA